MPEYPSSNQPLSAGDALPPVEPPSAGFILQLFIVPGVIVTIIVMVWLLFNWVARTGNDPQEYVRALRRNNAGRWQAAFNLANAIGGSGPQGSALRKDTRLAKDLTDILDEEIAKGSREEEPITLRVYLCEALGHFEVPTGLPVLLKAATTQHQPEEAEVQLAALRSLALLDANLRTAGDDAPMHTDEVTDTLLAASRNGDDPRIRATAAFALGQIGGTGAHQRLEAMLADGNPDVRFNAATWLAAAGDAESIGVLVEMLDPEEVVAGVEAEGQTAARPYKRAVIVDNGLRAAERLAAANPDADLSALTTAIERLVASPLEDSLKLKANQVLKLLKARPVPVH